VIDLNMGGSLIQHNVCLPMPECLVGWPDVFGVPFSFIISLIWHLSLTEFETDFAVHLILVPVLVSSFPNWIVIFFFYVPLSFFFFALIFL